jgi:anti-sigma B factor antagonist
MEINESKKGSTVVLAIKGSLDVMTSPELEKRLLSLLDAGTNDLVFDLSHLDYVSSAGLRVFMMALKRLQKDGKLRFCCLNKSVRQVFDIAGMSLRTTLCDSLEQAFR